LSYVRVSLFKIRRTIIKIKIIDKLLEDIKVEKGKNTMDMKNIKLQSKLPLITGGEMQLFQFKYGNYFEFLFRRWRVPFLVRKSGIYSNTILNVFIYFLVTCRMIDIRTYQIFFWGFYSSNFEDCLFGSIEVLFVSIDNSCLRSR
jgi:hypothetical protein